MMSRDTGRDGNNQGAEPLRGAGKAFLTLREVAQLLKLHPRTVRQYVHRGELVGRLIGGRWRFRQEDVDKFFDAAPSQWGFSEGPDNDE
jgi:excisionase family DNA binding protein